MKIIVEADKLLKKVMYSKILKISYKNSLRAYKRLMERRI